MAYSGRASPRAGSTVAPSHHHMTPAEAGHGHQAARVLGCTRHCGRWVGCAGGGRRRGERGQGAVTRKLAADVLSHAASSHPPPSWPRCVLPPATRTPVVVPVSTPNDTAEPQLLSMSPEQVGEREGRGRAARHASIAPPGLVLPCAPCPLLSSPPPAASHAPPGLLFPPAGRGDGRQAAGAGDRHAAEPAGGAARRLDAVRLPRHPASRLPRCPTTCGCGSRICFNPQNPVSKRLAPRPDCPACPASPAPPARLPPCPARPPPSLPCPPASTASLSRGARRAGA